MTTTGRHAAALYARHFGQPIIVIGGGPSAPGQWASLPAPWREAAVKVFANGHGFKLGLEPDFIVCKDDVHTETKQRMEPMLRAHGDYPIVAPHPWADYIMQGWPSQGNSGQLAIALAAMMGGWPVIPVGFDCYQNGTYFHAPDAPNVSLGRLESAWRHGMTRLMRRLDGAVIRALDGVMARMFPRFDPAEVLPEPRIPAIFDKYGLLTLS